jgi:cytochrome c-type biogenesis protein CcmE
MSKKTVRVLATVVILGGAFITVLATSMRENAQFYKHVDEVMPQAADWYDTGLQLHGFVVDGSIKKRPNSLDYRFEVKYGDSAVLAHYTGVVPDTFKDGAEVVLTGRLGQDGFKVQPNDGIMAKCPSKYEPGAVQPSSYAPLQGATR